VNFCARVDVNADNIGCCDDCEGIRRCGNMLRGGGNFIVRQARKFVAEERVVKEFLASRLAPAFNNESDGLQAVFA
jgi:hypothetical protein